MSDRAEFEKWYDEAADYNYGVAYYVDINGRYCFQDIEIAWQAWQAARASGATVPMTRIAEKKLEQMGATVHGVLVKNEAGAWAAVSEAGRVMWLDDFEGQSASAQGGQNAGVEQ